MQTNTPIITGRNEVVAKVMFLLVSVILFTAGVCLSACWDTTTPPEKHTPWEADTPQKQRLPPGKQTPLGSRHPPGKQTHPPGSRLRHTASYWNAFLLNVDILCKDKMELKSTFTILTELW